MVLALESLGALWAVVLLGGVVSLLMVGGVLVKMRAVATMEDVHEEVGSLEEKVTQRFRDIDARFESERKTAREANEKIYNRLNECAKGVTRVEAKFDSMEKMLARLLDKELKG